MFELFIFRCIIYIYYSIIQGLRGIVVLIIEYWEDREKIWSYERNIYKDMLLV